MQTLSFLSTAPPPPLPPPPQTTPPDAPPQMLGKCARQAQPLIAAILDKIRVEVAAKVMRAELFGPALPRDAEIVAALGGESYELEVSDRQSGCVFVCVRRLEKKEMIWSSLGCI